jgi:ribosomal protein S18 acetylase RimI-like enzyme
MEKKLIDPSHIKPEIRAFYDRDLESIKRIEKTAFIDWPWSTEDFVFFLRRLKDDHEAYISEWRENILGFMLVIRKPWCYEICSIAVSLEFRRMGVAKQLIDFLKGKLIPYSREDIYATVRESNKSASQFFIDQGFTTLEWTPNCYTDISEGCYKMKYEMVELPLKEEYMNL